MEIPLTCPQLMSEENLRSVLKDRCIEFNELDKMDKVKLVELFRRVALPLPQRKYSDRRLGKRMQNSRLERNVRVVDYDDNNDISTTVTKPSSVSEKQNSGKCQQNERLKPAIDDGEQINKRIRLNSCGQNNCIHDQNEKKRRNDVPLKTDTKKRQKVTWP